MSKATHSEHARHSEHASRRNFLKASAGLAVTVGSPGLLSACSGGSSGNTNVLKFGLSTYVANLDPFIDQGTAAGNISLALHRGLTGYDANGKLRPALAESWELEGPRTYKFQIRRNTRFHNGKTVTAKDVQASLDWVRDPQSSSAFLDRMQDIDRIETLDSYTVRVVLKRPNAAFLQYLAEPQVPIVPKSTVSKQSDEPIGAGPFTLHSAQKGTEIRVKKFDKYYEDGLPHLDDLRFIIYEDSDLRTTALLSGDVHVIDYVPWESFDSVKEKQELTLDTTTKGPFMYLVFNVEDGPFSATQVRQAVAYGINRKEIVRAAFFGEGEPLYGMPIPSSSPFFDDKLSSHWQYDPDKAKRLLAEAGYPKGFSATMLSTSQYKMHKDTAETVQSNLREIGINLELNLPDWATRVQQGDKGKYDIAVMGSALDYNDPSALQTFLIGSASYVRSFGFEDKEIEDLLASGLTIKDKEERQVVYDKIQKIALHKAPLVTLTWRTEAYAYQQNVSGFKNLPGPLTYLSGYTFPRARIQSN